jgi:zinc protease
VERGLASSVAGSIVPTADPFIYNISLTAMEGVALASLEEATLATVEQVREQGITAEELRRAQRQLRARLVFENDSVTNIAHQLGFFETVVGPGFYDELLTSVERVTAEQVADVARRRLGKDQRTVGWFQPVERRI